MLGHLRALICLLVPVALLVGVAAPDAVASSARGAAAASAEEGGSPGKCASAVAGGYTVPTEPTRGNPCWVEVSPYPFGSFESPSGAEEAGPVEIENPRWREEHPWCLRFGRERPTGPGGGGAAPEAGCYLTVTSMAFRSWNHGVAATFPQTLIHDNASSLTPRAEKNPYGVWIFEDTPETGPQWFPDPTFPGRKVCPGHTIVWSGKLDYWLVGGPADKNWSRLCRFDGATGQWQPFSVPAATLRRITPPVIGPAPTVSGRAAVAHLSAPVLNPVPRRGGITSAACLAWWDCWFFGSYGAAVHWNGLGLSDASPSAGERWLDGEYIAAATNEYPLGNPFAEAVSGTAEYGTETKTQRELVPPRPSPPGAPASAPPQLFRSLGAEFFDSLIGGSSALPFSPPTNPQVDPSGWEDPYRTDLVAVGFNEAGQGWVAGNPAGHRTNWACSTVEETCPRPESYLREMAGAEALAPLVPVSTSGAEQKCTAGEFAPEKLTYSRVFPPKEPASFLWSSLAVVPEVGAVGESQLPATGEAFAGGLERPREVEGTELNSPGTLPEPVIVQASCDGRITTTRFRAQEAADEEHTEHTERTAADRGGTVTTLVASAKNDAWGTTSDGRLVGKPKVGDPSIREQVLQPPRMYQFTDGQPPMAPEGNDEEERPVELQENPPIFIFEPEPEAPRLPAPPPVTSTTTTHEGPAVYGIKATLHRTGNTFSLYLSFKLHRPVTLGAEALLRGRVVARARARHFTGHKGVLVLQLNRQHWPTKIRFTS